MTCTRDGLLHWKVAVETARLVTQKCALSSCHWRDADGGTQFCPTCGTAMMRTGYRGRIAVNGRCLDGIDMAGCSNRSRRHHAGARGQPLAAPYELLTNPDNRRH